MQTDKQKKNKNGPDADLLNFQKQKKKPPPKKPQNAMSTSHMDDCEVKDVRIIKEHNRLQSSNSSTATFYKQVFHGMRNTLTEEALDKNKTFDSQYQEAVRTAHTAIKLGCYYKYLNEFGLRAQQKKHFLNHAPLDFKKLPLSKKV